VSNLPLRAFPERPRQYEVLYIAVQQVPPRIQHCLATQEAGQLDRKVVFVALFSPISEDRSPPCDPIYNIFGSWIEVWPFCAANG